ncbi:MAG: hypothetical protein SFV55_04415 [Haliscomenobacter sp.]|nr:hypothetical protein [Haliscomenobacter sp.]
MAWGPVKKVGDLYPVKIKNVFFLAFCLCGSSYSNRAVGVSKSALIRPIRVTRAAIVVALACPFFLP